MRITNQIYYKNLDFSDSKWSKKNTALMLLERREIKQNCTIRDYIYLTNILYLTKEINENEK